MATKNEELTLAQVTALVRLTKKVEAFNNLLSGSTDPTSSTGTSGDWYINTTTKELFGPKGSSWGAGITLGVTKAEREQLTNLTVGGNLGSGGGSGSAATIAVGTTTTGDAGTDAAVTNVGTSSTSPFHAATLALRAQQVPPAQKAPKASKAKPAHKALKAKQAQLVRPDPKARKAIKAFKANRASKVSRAKPAPLVQQAPKAPKATQALKAQLEPLQPSPSAPSQLVLRAAMLS